MPCAQHYCSGNGLYMSPVPFKSSSVPADKQKAGRSRTFPLSAPKLRGHARLHRPEQCSAPLPSPRNSHRQDVFEAPDLPERPTRKRGHAMMIVSYGPRPVLFPHGCTRACIPVLSGLALNSLGHESHLRSGQTRWELRFIVSRARDGKSERSVTLPPLKLLTMLQAGTEEFSHVRHPGERAGEWRPHGTCRRALCSRTGAKLRTGNADRLKSYPPMPTLMLANGP
jgi:hypothetical protein